MHYTTAHSSFHRKPPHLLTDTPFTWSKPRILSHQGLSTGSKTPFLPLILLKKATWPTFPQALKSKFPLKMASSKKSPLELLALLRKSPHINPSSKNIRIFFLVIHGNSWPRSLYRRTSHQHLARHYTSSSKTTTATPIQSRSHQSQN
jgi:hypothetical protein